MFQSLLKALFVTAHKFNMMPVILQRNKAACKSLCNSVITLTDSFRINSSFLSQWGESNPIDEENCKGNGKGKHSCLNNEGATNYSKL